MLKDYKTNQVEFISNLFKQGRITVYELLEYFKDGILKEEDDKKFECQKKEEEKNELNPFKRPDSCEFVSIQTTDRKTGKHKNSITTYCPTEAGMTMSDRKTEEVDSNDPYLELMEVPYQKIKKSKNQ